MPPSAAALARRYGELEMPVIVIAGKEDRIVDFARQSARLDNELKESVLISLEDSGHMIHHTEPVKVVEAVDWSASRSVADEVGLLAGHGHISAVAGAD